MNKNFSSDEKLTLEEACLILGITSPEKFNKEQVQRNYELSYHATKLQSPYLAERIEDAKNLLMEQFESK